MTCKGICNLYETKSITGSSIDLDIFKKCTICRVRIKSEKINCPCCGRRLSLRTKRGTNNKSIITKMQNIVINT